MSADASVVCRPTRRWCVGQHVGRRVGWISFVTFTPELWLRKTFPCTVFVNTSLPEKRCRVAKSQEEIEALDDDSTDIFMSNIIERYSDRPNIVDQLCLAEFASYYYKDYN